MVWSALVRSKRSRFGLNTENQDIGVPVTFTPAAAFLLDRPELNKRVCFYVSFRLK